MKILNSAIKYLSLNKLLILFSITAFTFVLIFFVWWQTKEIIVINDSFTLANNLPKSSISGLGCENYDKKPVAVMLSSDAVTRPLSGISQADIVFEMPVTPGGVTRIMAVYQCNQPDEIGSVRSARNGFIPLAGGMDAVFVHWGGERTALEKLNLGVLDNIDAMKYEGVYYYRKNGIRRPHDGFTSFEMILKAVDNLGYGTNNKFSGYPHGERDLGRNVSNIADSIVVDYPAPFDVVWAYDYGSNDYKRLRAGEPETDNDNGKEVGASVVIVMEAEPVYINQDYMDIDISGSGNAKIYHNGTVVEGKWEKGEDLADKLYFYDRNGDEIEFAPGIIWVEIITKN